LGRTPSPAEVDSWVRALAGGMTPDQVAYGFAASPEREAQRITADYRIYLGRTPEPGVVNSWVTAFQNGWSNETVIAGFVSSLEYYANSAKGRGHKVDWLEHMYLDVLHREPSADELQAWASVLR
jgi:hypothetical protein